MRTISVYLDDKAEECLLDVMKKNDCTISDVVVMGIYALAQSPDHPVLYKPNTLFNRVKSKIEEVSHISLDDYCDLRKINKRELASLCRRIEKGAYIRGFGGDKNKWRDKNDERLFRTKTAFIAWSIQEDIGINIEEF